MLNITLVVTLENEHKSLEFGLGVFLTDVYGIICLRIAAKLYVTCISIETPSLGGFNNAKLQFPGFFREPTASVLFFRQLRLP